MMSNQWKCVFVMTRCKFVCSRCTLFVRVVFRTIPFQHYMSKKRLDFFQVSSTRFYIVLKAKHFMWPGFYSKLPCTILDRKQIAVKNVEAFNQEDIVMIWENFYKLIAMPYRNVAAEDWHLRSVDPLSTIFYIERLCVISRCTLRPSSVPTSSHRIPSQNGRSS